MEGYYYGSKRNRLENCGLDSSASGLGLAVGYYESGNEPSGSIIGGEFLDKLSDFFNLLKKGSMSCRSSDYARCFHFLWAENDRKLFKESPRATERFSMNFLKQCILKLLKQLSIYTRN
jgi:hypothetical protein